MDNLDNIEIYFFLIGENSIPVKALKMVDKNWEETCPLVYDAVTEELEMIPDPLNDGYGIWTVDGDEFAMTGDQTFGKEPYPSEALNIVECYQLQRDEPEELKQIAFVCHAA